MDLATKQDLRALEYRLTTKVGAMPAIGQVAVINTPCFLITGAEHEYNGGCFRAKG